MMYRKIIYTVILAAGHFLYVDAQEADAAIGIPQGCYYTPEATESMTVVSSRKACRQAARIACGTYARKNRSRLQG